MNACRIFLTLFIFFFFCCSPAYGQQQRKADSLRKVLKAAKADTQRVRLLNELGSCYRFNNVDTSLVLSRQALKLAEAFAAGAGEKDTVAAKKILADSYYALAGFLMEKGDYSASLGYARKAEAIYLTSPAYKKKLAATHEVMGTVYSSQGNYTKGLEEYLEALVMFEELKDTTASSSIYNGVAGVYYSVGDLDHALEYVLRMLEIQRRAKNKSGIALAMGNAANIYSDRGDNVKALDYYRQALALYGELNSKSGMATNLGNIGDVYATMGQYDTALVYYRRALQINRERGKIDNIARHLGNIGAVYTRMERYSEAEEYLLRSLAICDSLDLLSQRAVQYKRLSELYAATGQWKNAYKNHMLYTADRDSLYNAEKNDEITRTQIQYEFEKEAQADSLARAAEKQENDLRNELRHEQEINTQKTYTYAGAGGLVLMIALAFVLYRGYQQKQKTNTWLAEKNRSILDSITYAKHLQEAILPPERLVKQFLPESFVLYKPKDIVAGDFYFLEEKDGKVIFAVADCTGHGVPGAMVSVVCSNALARAVKEFGLTDPGRILDKVTMLVLETFSKSESDVKDGMDISLVAIDTRSGEVKFSGAYNSLLYFSRGELHEANADKQPVGKTENPHPFTTHTLRLEKGDWLYLLTDGYADQFGGPRGKKFKYRPLKTLLAAGTSLSPEAQKQKLDETIESWRGNLEQVDDVCVAGIKLV